MATPDQGVTGLLQAWGGGDAAALDQLVPIVYDELRRQAQRYLRRENPGHTLQTTALVHEAYLRLVDQREARWQNRAQFFGIAAQAHAADPGRPCPAPSGGQARRIGDPGALRGGRRGGSGVRRGPGRARRCAHAAGAVDPQQARVVELRYFTGLGIEETAEALGISMATVKREWAMARAWLRRELGER